jgi:hypothetical protein
MAEVNLFPRKEFEIILDGGEKIRGQFSLYSSKLFADKKNLTLQGLLELRDAEKLTLDDVCQLLLCAVHALAKKEKRPFDYSDLHACDWIDQLGGLDGELFGKVMGHAVSELPAAEGGDAEEKKSL